MVDLALIPDKTHASIIYPVFYLILFFVFYEGCGIKQKNQSESVASAAFDQSAPKMNLTTITNPNDQEDFQMKLWRKGIDFYARGNEPSWALDIDFEGNFHFKTLDGFEITVPSAKGDKASDTNVIRYYKKIEAGRIIITIGEQRCRDTMSGQSFHFGVNIQVKSAAESDFGEYQGCGNYVADYSLHDIWLLTTINGVDLKSKNGNSANLPIFEFYAREGKVLGNTGCNDFNETYYISGKQELQFGEISLTEKGCGDMSVENFLIKSVFGRRVKYTKENLTLKLSGYDGMEILFKKID